MTNQSTIDKLIEMRLTSMSDAFITQMNDPKMKEVSFECVLRRPVATSAFASGHPALPVAGVNQPLFVQS